MNKLLAALLTLLVIPLSGQRPDRSSMDPTMQIIKGVIIEETNGAALEFATVSAFDLSGTLLAGVMTETDGSFTLKIPKVDCRILVEYLGYQNYEQELSIGPRPMTQLGNISMVSNDVLLEDVEITAERSETVFKLDKKVFNVGSDLANRGGTAEDILDNVPSLAVDIEGGVTLRGSGNVRFLLNGQPSAMLNNADGSALRQIQASSIERIEVITNPSAKYEAEGTSGIVNIVLKKERQKGFNGSFTAGITYPFGYNLGGQVNYKSGKVNYFVNYGTGLRRNIGGGWQNSQFFEEDYTFIQNYTNFRDRKGQNQNVTAGLDIEVAPNQILTFSGTFSYADEDNFAEFEYVDSILEAGTREYIQTAIRTDDEFENERDQEYTIRYVNDFGKKDKSLSAFIKYVESNEIEGSDLTETSDAFMGEIKQRSNNEEGEESIIGQMDYKLPGVWQTQWETGARVSLRTIGNTFLVEERLGDVWTPNPNFNNSFTYNEDVYAGYGIVGKEWDKFSAQVGLRAEYTQIGTLLAETNESEDYNYLDFFPSAYLNYKVNEQNTWQINYSRRITRPRFWYLNPFFTFGNNRNIWSGNPALRPEYTHAFELNYLQYFEKGTISSGIYFRHTDGLIQRLVTVNTDGTTRIQPYNLGSQDQIGLEFSSNYDITKSIRLDGNLNIFGFNTVSVLDFGEEEIQAASWQGRVGARFKFWKNTEMQWRYNFRGPERTVQGRRKFVNYVNFGISKDFLEDKLTLSISSNDLFATRLRRFEFDTPEYYAEGEGRYRGTTINFSANYRVNQKKKRAKGNWNGGDGGGF